ncbi:translation factor/ribosome maturation factor [Mycoplasmoides gallisepticum]|uniref:L-threonylcarbamoyladenylate synthase n=1 Tax=Mycoplasmoides gallisepticum TaxID=2096 RepID=A0AB36DRU8_MYCGL|nr:L-threonylcarbamoyladenylate synthase [Mycoplasmoides gallisepticum]OBU78405.1 translation factor/ribosome maturation factor [Mycoplasmoides gallisepticum]OBU79327.1 translation factor/ribosome maturation factor [Mycoplasmoides gallisepticum]OBU80599.1 translation factor/ribosome maturation factor [Mycoplasmoides gallisepticum]OBU80894.1 translation factor/ribosome maturation factor [Mycoplasmoides gallisepticum]OBU80928.1 translation factor/ribosome maturation factor [Mycoplasmoides gallis
MKVLEFEKNFDEIVKAINDDKLVILPTDTVFGVICKSKNKIYDFKKRDLNKKLIYLCSDVEQTNINDKLFLDLVNRFWPGKLTLIYNKESYRIPNSPYILKIAKICGKIYSSSANISNLNPYKTWEQYYNDPYFNQNNDVVLIKGETTSEQGSTIYDLDSNKILREGELSQSLKEFLANRSK